MAWSLILKSIGKSYFVVVNYRLEVVLDICTHLFYCVSQFTTFRSLWSIGMQVMCLLRVYFLTHIENLYLSFQTTPFFFVVFIPARHLKFYFLSFHSSFSLPAFPFLYFFFRPFCLSSYPQKYIPHSRWCLVFRHSFWSIFFINKKKKFTYLLFLSSTDIFFCIPFNFLLQEKFLTLLVLF